MDPKFLHPLYCLFLNNREQLKFFSPDIDSTSCTTSANGSKVESGATMETDDAQASESPSMSLATLQQNALIGGRPASIFHIASRLLMMQLFVSQGDWRIPIIWQNLSQQLEQFIDQPFKIIRERVGRYEHNNLRIIVSRKNCIESHYLASHSFAAFWLLRTPARLSCIENRKFSLRRLSSYATCTARLRWGRSSSASSHVLSNSLRAGLLRRQQMPPRRAPYRRQTARARSPHMCLPKPLCAACAVLA